MVTRARIDWGASTVIFAGLLALIVDMFLGWVKVTVYSAGSFGTPLTFDMQVTGSGWAGWGIVGGILAVVLVFWHAWPLRRRRISVRAAAVAVALATAGFTIWHRRGRRRQRGGDAVRHCDQAVAGGGSNRSDAAVAVAATTRPVIAAVGVRRRATGRSVALTVNL